MKKVEKDEVSYDLVNFPYFSTGRYPVGGEDKGRMDAFPAFTSYDNRFLKRTPQPAHSWQDTPEAGTQLNALLLYPRRGKKPMLLVISF
jgi:hypothetical protein